MGGHTRLLLLNQSTVIKPLNIRELDFYQNIPKDIQAFVPKYKGECHSLCVVALLHFNTYGLCNFTFDTVISAHVLLCHQVDPQTDKFIFCGLCSATYLRSINKEEYILKRPKRVSFNMDLMKWRYLGCRSPSRGEFR